VTRLPGIGLRRRILFLLTCFFVFSVVLTGRLAYLQFVRGAELRERAFNIRTHEVPVEAKRGVIYDRNGRELAISVNVDSIFAVPAEVEDPPETARKLADVIGLDYEWVLERLTQNQSFVWVKRKVSDEVSKAVKLLQLPGIGFTQESRRVYPKGTLAAHVIGFAGIDSQGLDGVEYIYDRELRGSPGWIVIEYDALGREIPQALHRYIPPTDGYDLYLTIDEVVQSMVERELDRIVALHQPKKATIIVMDPHTGEILGLGVRPTYDPNNYADYPPSTWRNFAVSDTYHPGSTFKPITAIAAVEEGVVDWNSRFSCGGSLVVEDRTIWCHSTHGGLDLTGVIEKSCNVGFMNIGLRLGKERFYRYYRALGLDSLTGIDLPGEAEGFTIPQEQCRKVDLAVMSFGQTLAVTPIELIRAMAVIANGGYLVTPHVAKEFRDKEGRVVTVLDWPVGPQVISEDTAREVRRAMEAVVKTGTGRVAYMPGYRLAGKTGTAQKTVGGVVSADVHVASFCGFGPAEDPRIIVLVVVDEPKGSYYGGVVAAPAFGRLMRDLYRYYEIPLVYTDEEEPRPRDGDRDVPDEVTVPDTVGLPVGEALAALREAGVRAAVAGDVGGEVVVRQTPGPGAEVPPGTLVILEVGEGDLGAELVTVPSVKGRSVADAALRLEQAGLHIRVEGSGIAVAQAPAAGAAVPRGTTVTVTFEPPPGSSSDLSGRTGP